MGELKRILWREGLGRKKIVRWYDPILMGVGSDSKLRRRSGGRRPVGESHAGDGLGQSHYTIHLGIGSVMVLIGFLTFAGLVLVAMLYLLIGAWI